MYISAEEIYEEIKSEKLIIEPFEPLLLKPASYVLRLGKYYRRWKTKTEPVKVWSQNAAQNHLEPVNSTSEIELLPGQFILASTLEKLGIPKHLTGMLSTLSHLSRLGVSVIGSSFWVSPGFGAETPTEFTLELVSSNPSPVVLKIGIPVCHLILARTSQSGRYPIKLHKSVYEGDRAPSGPFLFEEFRPILGKIEKE